MTPSSDQSAQKLAILYGAPTLFVFLWATGFIGSRLGIPFAEPFSFLAVRFAIVSALLTLLALAGRARWPETWRDGGHILVAGLLLQATYLGGVFTAVEKGVPTSVVALITGLQPILTAFAVGPLLGERVSLRQWAGFLLGFLGVAMVVWERLGVGSGSPLGYIAATCALLGITVGTLYQKRFCPALDPRTGTALQMGGAALAVALVALVFETRQIQWTGQFIFALGWLVLVLSIGAFNLLSYLIRHGQASRVTSLFYLVPPVTAVIGYALFDEVLSLLALGGMAVAIIGVALVNR